MLVVHMRAGEARVVHAAVVRRTRPDSGRFRRYGGLWISPADTPASPGEARWGEAQKADFWDCVIDRSASTAVSCAIGCIFTAGGWWACVGGCTTIGEITTLAGCAARVLINTWRGNYEPKEQR
jgi:hypothetical protein